MYLEDPAGCAERGAKLCAGGEHPALRLDGSAIAVLEPKDTAVYKLIATKPGEAASEG